MQFRGRFIVCSQRASCALYELEEVGLRGGALMQWPYQRLTLSLLSAITNCACPGPNGGRVGIYWGGGDTPYIGSPLLLLEPPKPFTDILALSAFLALMGYSRAGGGFSLFGLDVFSHAIPSGGIHLRWGGFVRKSVYKKSLVLEKEPFKTSGSFLMLNNRRW